MAYLRVYLGFASASSHVIEETTGHVLAGIYANATIYPAPPVSAVALQAGLTAFTTAVAAQKDGGPAATALKNQQRAALVALLRRLAMYVQDTIQGNPAYGLAELLLSGFDAVSTSRTQHPLATPTILKIDNSGDGSLTLRVKPSANARTYEVQSQLVVAGGAPGPWTSAGLFQNSRAMEVTGLTPGAMYNFQVRAVGGSTGYSQWSDAVGHRSL